MAVLAQVLVVASSVEPLIALLSVVVDLSLCEDACAESKSSFQKLLAILSGVGPALSVMTASAWPKQTCALDLDTVIALSQVNPAFWRIAGALGALQEVKSDDGSTTFDPKAWDDRCFRVDEEREREKRLRQAAVT